MFVFLMQFPNICVFSKMLCSDSDYINLLMIVTLGCGPVYFQTRFAHRNASLP